MQMECEIVLTQIRLILDYAVCPYMYLSVRHDKTNNVAVRHDKTNNVAVRPAKTQISLGIRPV